VGRVEAEHKAAARAVEVEGPGVPPAQEIGNQDAYAAPPPAYTEAINYPTLNAYQPNVNYAASSPHPNASYAPQPNASYAPHPNARQPQQQFAYPPPPHPTGGAVSPQVVVHQRVVLGQPCRFCRSGVVRDETDLCCLIFLVILAIVTFPFGLIFLCCLGCATRRRCVQCRRLH